MSGMHWHRAAAVCDVDNQVITTLQGKRVGYVCLVMAQGVANNL